MKRKRVHKAVVMEVPEHPGTFEAMCLKTGEWAYAWPSDFPYTPIVDAAVAQIKAVAPYLTTGGCDADHEHA